MKSRTSSRARRVETPAAVMGAAGLAGTDYASSFEVAITDADAVSAEQWARTIFEGAPTVLRWFLVIGWRAVLWLRLGPRPSPDHVLGWEIVTATPQTITLRARSRLVTAHKVLDAADGRLTVTTVVRYERPVARLVWSALQPIHHRIESALITRAVRR